jgi:hypothetical protein
MRTTTKEELYALLAEFVELTETSDENEPGTDLYSLIRRAELLLHTETATPSGGEADRG